MEATRTYNYDDLKFKFTFKRKKNNLFCNDIPSTVII
jgi:hypothetical protein